MVRKLKSSFANVKPIEENINCNANMMIEIIKYPLTYVTASLYLADDEDIFVLFMLSY